MYSFRMKSKKKIPDPQIPNLILTEYMGADKAAKKLLEKNYGKRQLRNLELELETFMSETYVSDNTKPCPKCWIPIQKSEGCNKMTCNK